MPQDPHTWGTNEYVTAARLDYDLYSAGAGFPVNSYFIPNGIRWHSRKALYKAFQTGSVSIGAGTWARIFTGTAGTAAVLNDTSGRYGALMDTNRGGVITDAIYSSGGGLPNATGGGWYLMTGVASIVPGGSLTGFNAGISLNSTTPLVAGGYLRGNPAHNVAPFVVDLIKTGVSPYTLDAFSGSTASVTTSASTDGSSAAARFTAQWASVVAGSGSDNTASVKPAPKASWSSTDTITSAFLNGATGVRDILRSWNWPPALRAHDGTSPSIPSATATAIPLTVDLDTYSGYSGSTYTVARDGLYFVHGLVTFGNFSGQTACAVSVNGTLYYGPGMPNATTGNASASKTQIFSLRAGDTLQLMAWQNSGGAIATSSASSNQSRLVVLKVSDFGVPSPPPTVPDLSFRWTAGMPPDLSGTLNSRLANDLTFLTYKPYVMAWQSTAQTGIAMSTDTTVINNNATGQIHADSGDNYAGFNTSTGVYTCQRSGWYLGVHEVFMAYPSITTQPSVLAEFQVTPSGTSSTWDHYQQVTMSSTNNAPGATAVAYYYLRAGDTIRPGLWTVDSSSTTTSTTVTGRNSHFELVWISE